MAAASSRRSSSGPVIRSLSPSGRFYNSPYKTSRSCSSSSAFAYSTSSFASRSSTLFHRSASPTRVNLSGNSKQTTSAQSVRFSLDQRPISPSRSISTTSSRNHRVLKSDPKPKRTCMCSPTNHPGSFRCSLHKNCNTSQVVSTNNRLNARRSAMTNSLVRIGGVEGDLVKRALSALIRPSSHQQRRRAAFQPRPSRLSVMTKAEDL